jgi:hypothetical protein
LVAVGRVQQTPQLTDQRFQVLQVRLDSILESVVVTEATEQQVFTTVTQAVLVVVVVVKERTLVEQAR